jgi:hypothetical protein
LLEDIFIKIVTQIQPYFALYTMILIAYKGIRIIPPEGEVLTAFEKRARIFSKYSLILGSILLIIELIMILKDL